MLIVADGDEVVGQIEFYPPVTYWDAFELSYQLYQPEQSGRGYVTESVQLLVDYLFATKKQNRIQLVIVPENVASRRIAEKCGFTLEGTARGAFFNDGRSQDLLIYSFSAPTVDRGPPRDGRPGEIAVWSYRLMNQREGNFGRWTDDRHEYLPRRGDAGTSTD